MRARASCAERRRGGPARTRYRPAVLLLLVGCRGFSPESSPEPVGPADTTERTCGPRLPLEFALSARVELADTAVFALPADFDEDGNVDLATTTHDEMLIAAGRGDGTFDAPFGTVPSQGFPFLAEDVNGDGHADLVVHTGGVLHGYTGDGAFGFIDSHTIDFAAFGGIATGDFDGDGLRDLAGMSSSTVAVALAFGGLDRLSSAGYPGELGVADLDHDGSDELIVGYDEALRVYRWRDGWTVWQELGDLGLDNPMVGLGDIDGDGTTDLVTGSRYFTDGLRIARGRWDGTFGAVEVLDYDIEAVGGLVLRDLDGDCLDEIVVVSYYYGILIESVGEGGLVRRASIDTAPFWLELADINNDGWLDIAADVNHRELEVYLGGVGVVE